MNHFFQRQYSQEDLQHRLQRRRQHATRGVSMGGSAAPMQQDDSMVDSSMLGGESLDDIIMQNNKELQRRQSFPQRFGGDMAEQDPVSSASNMMQFGSRNDSLNSFQFGSPGAQDGGGTQDEMGGVKVSMDELMMGPGFVDMSQNLNMGGQMGGFSNPIHSSDGLGMVNSPMYQDASVDMMGNMMSYAGLNVSGNSTPMNPTFDQNSFIDPFAGNDMAGFSMPIAHGDNRSNGMANGSHSSSGQGQDEDMTFGTRNQVPQMHNMASNVNMNQLSNMGNSETGRMSRSVPPHDNRFALQSRHSHQGHQPKQAQQSQQSQQMQQPQQPQQSQQSQHSQQTQQSRQSQQSSQPRSQQQSQQQPQQMSQPRTEQQAQQHSQRHPEVGQSQQPLRGQQNQSNANTTNVGQGHAVQSQSSQQGGQKPNYSNIYSASGFDMLGALMRVAMRKNPEINIGAVDMSCAFVVCDVTQPDCPIVYVSDIFERLTGYNKHEVLGRNCRFLQAPDGKVMAGNKRKYVDDESVYYLKNRIKNQKEAQRSLINYRKGGQPFMNLLTMIPITWDTDEIRYIVGFQVDLVEQPSSVAGKGQGGSYNVNYSQGMLPRYVWTPPDGSRGHVESGQTISRDEVSTVLASFSNHQESELTKRMWDKVLLENTDDVIHVLSLKGLFLYLSPSCRTVLEYDAAELVGTALSSVCHPSDIVPVTRELKDTSTGASVNVVFRIRRKTSGYTWFESHGSLCVEQGKGRKCIILIGRERPVYALARSDVALGGGIGDSELWTKLSTSGMFLFVSSNVRTLLDRHPDDLVGTSIQSLMRLESKVEFGRSLEKARTGQRVTYKHEVMNKRGQVLQAQTTLHPGDASEGTKPTFLVGQIRLLKPSSRPIPPTLSSHASSRSITSIGNGGTSDDTGRLNTPSSQMILHRSTQRGDETSRSNDSGLTRENIMTHAGGSGLAIGSQDVALASEDNIFDELKTTHCTSWQFELRQMEKSNRLLAEELAALLQDKKKRKRRKGAGNLQRDCANCHTRVTPEWRRGPSGNRDLCNSCGLRWAKQNGRVSPRTSSRGDAGSKHSASPQHSSPLQKEVSLSNTPNLNPNPNQSGTTVLEGNMQSVLGPGKRTTAESRPVHAPSQGFMEGGPSGITKTLEEPAS